MFKKNDIYIIFCFLVLFFCIFSTQINAQTTINSGTIKIAHSEPEIDLVSTPYYALTHTMKDIIERETQGRFKVDIFPGSQLGSVRSLLEQTQRGSIEIITALNTAVMASYYPSIQILEIPYLFENTEIGRVVLDGPLGKKLEKEFLEASGLRVLGWMPNSLRHFLNTKKEIRTPEDIKGMKIRTMEVPIHMTMVESLGASATPIAWNELYIALQTGVIDGSEQPPHDVMAAKLHEVEKYYTLDGHFLNTSITLINEDFFNKLSKEDQRIIEYAARQSTFALLGVITAATTEYLNFLETEGGMHITTLTPEERLKFKELAQPAVIEALRKDKEISNDLIDELLQAVEDAEKQFGVK